jgi:serine phosphatase RsbU (regulator of sigma subunit)
MVALVIAATLVGIVGLVALRRGPDDRRFSSLHRELRELAHLDSMLEAEVLSTSSGRVHDYDGLVELLNLIESANARARSHAAASSFDAADAAIASRRVLIEGFKRHNSILRHSMEFLPTALRTAHQELDGVEDDRELLFQLGLLASHLQARHADHATQPDAAEADLLARADAGSPALHQLAGHLRLVEREQRTVDGLIGKLQALSHPSPYQALARDLEARQASALAAARRDDGLLLALGLALLAGCVVVIRRHQVARRHSDQLLAQTRRQVADQEHELAIASRIQTSILPRSLEIRGLDVTARMVPATEVGGDYYDVVPVWDGCWIGIGDVTGHGLNAGLIMLMVQSALAALVRQQPDAAPRELVRLLNQVVYDNVRKRLGERDHVTFSLLRYHADGRVVFAGAHEELVICRAADGRCERIDTPGTWLGGMANVDRFTVDSRVQLDDGDLLLLHTDGITESMDQAGEQFGVERLCRVLERNRHLPTDRIRDAMFEAVSAWTGQQVDDRTVVLARYDRTLLSLPAPMGVAPVEGPAMPKGDRPWPTN